MIKKIIGYIRLLETYLRLGLKLKKINDILFKEKSFMKKYIEKNTKLHQKSLRKKKKDIYKLKNNSVYGKTMENVRKYRVSQKKYSGLIYDNF